jgi:hypothetical protein
MVFGLVNSNMFHDVSSGEPGRRRLERHVNQRSTTLPSNILLSVCEGTAVLSLFGYIICTALG